MAQGYICRKRVRKGDGGLHRMLLFICGYWNMCWKDTVYIFSALNFVEITDLEHFLYLFIWLMYFDVVIHFNILGYEFN